MVRSIFNFQRGQCLFIRANRQTNRYRLLSFRNLFFSVFVHKGSIFQKRACFLFAHNRIVDICPHGIRLEKHRDIIVRFRIFCKMSKFICSVFQRFQFCGVQLKEQNRENFDSAFHGYFFAKRPISPIFFIIQTDIEPHHIACPDRSILLLERKGFHIGTKYRLS